jgi:hypothetical protein
MWIYLLGTPLVSTSIPIPYDRAVSYHAEGCAARFWDILLALQTRRKRNKAKRTNEQKCNETKNVKQNDAKIIYLKAKQK